jgi:hypothetical protein
LLITHVNTWHLVLKQSKSFEEIKGRRGKNLLASNTDFAVE